MKTGILLTARLKSTRLPRKAIKLIKGRPMLSHLLDRLKQSKRAERIVVCTSPLPEDAPLVELAEQEGCDFFRGDPKDVLSRLTDAAKHFEITTIVNCTADNPFTDPLSMDRLVDFHHSEGNDYTHSEGLPFGTFSRVLSRSAMERVCAIKAETDTEVYEEYFTTAGLFKVGLFSFQDPKIRRPDLRLTVDTPSDFELISIIFDKLHREGEPFKLDEIVALMDRYPDLRKINEKIVQKIPIPIRFEPKEKWPLLDPLASDGQARK